MVERANEFFQSAKCLVVSGFDIAKWNFTEDELPVGASFRRAATQKFFTGCPAPWAGQVERPQALFTSPGQAEKVAFAAE